MLYFATRPDPVFTAVIDAALATAANWVDIPECWQTLAHHVVDGFPRHENPRAALTKLQAAHRSPAVHRMSHFYWVLFYDCVAAYIKTHNGRIPRAHVTGAEQMPAIGPFRVGRIDLSSVVATYCWDLGFFPDAVGDRSLIPPPVTHRTRGGADRYATSANGLDPIRQPRWDHNPDAAELANPAVGIARYPMFTAPAVLDAW
jgi:hypothetical protein